MSLGDLKSGSREMREKERAAGSRGNFHLPAESTRCAPPRYSDPDCKAVGLVLFLYINSEYVSSNITTNIIIE